MSLFTNTDIWEKIVYQLNGSCDSLNQVLADCEAEELEDHSPFLNYLDNEIFCCNSCGWWSPISEIAENDNWQCRDCDENEE